MESFVGGVTCHLLVINVCKHALHTLVGLLADLWPSLAFLASVQFQSMAVRSRINYTYYNLTEGFRLCEFTGTRLT